MMMDTGQQQTPQPNGGVPPPELDGEAAKYEALRKQYGIEPEAEEPQPELQPEPEPKQEPAAAQPEPAKTKPSYEELEEHSRKTAGALKEAREAQRAADERLAQMLRIIEEVRARPQEKQEKKPEAPKLPEVQADPIGHFDGRIAQLEAALRQSQQGSQQQTQQIQAQLQEQAMWGAVQQAEADIRDPRSPNHKADYDDACNHLIAVRARQLDRFYPNENPAVIAEARQAGFATPAEYKQALLNNEGRALIMRALHAGASPAAMLYDLALDSGYQSKAAAKPNGQQPGLAERAQQQIAAAKAGAKAAVTLSGGPGGKGAENLSIPELTAMFADDPDKAMVIFRRMGEQGLLG